MVLWVRSLTISHKIAIKGSARAPVSSEDLTRRICLPAHSLSCWQDAVPCGLWTEGLAPCWPMARVLPQFLGIRGSPEGSSQLDNWLLSEQVRERERERGGDRERTKEDEQEENRSFCNLIWEATSHPFCCIFFVRSKSLGQAQPHRDAITQGCEHQEAGITGPFCGGCLPQLPILENAWGRAPLTIRKFYHSFFSLNS